MTAIPEELLLTLETRNPTEAETLFLPATIADDGGMWERIPISQQQVEVLLRKRFIYFCGHCTKTTIEIDASGEETDESTYAAREYHTREALCDVEDGDVYLEQILAASRE